MVKNRYQIDAAYRARKREIARIFGGEIGRIDCRGGVTARLDIGAQLDPTTLTLQPQVDGRGVGSFFGCNFEGIANALGGFRDDFEREMRRRIHTVANKNLGRVARDVEKRLATWGKNLQIMSRVEEAFAGVGGDLGDGFRLTVAPVALYHDGLRLNPEEMTIGLGARFRARVSTETEAPGDSPEIDVAPLADKDLVLNLSGELPLKKIESLLSDGVSGAPGLRNAQVGPADRPVYIRSLSIDGGDGTLLIAIDLDGELRGRLWFKGTPCYDPRTDLITIPDLHATAETSQAVALVVAWFKLEDLVTRIRSQAKWSPSQQIPRIEVKLEEALADMLRGVGCTDVTGITVHAPAVSSTAVLVATTVEGGSATIGSGLCTGAEPRVDATSGLSQREYCRGH